MDQITMVVCAQLDSEYRGAVERFMAIMMAALVFVGAVRYTFFKVYIFLEVAIQFLVVVVYKWDLQPLKALIEQLELGQQNLAAHRHPYLLPIALNVLVNLIGWCRADFRGLCKLADFGFELMISAINAAELHRVLLEPQGWSRPSIVVMHLVSIILLELASWNPWSALNSIPGGLEPIDMEALTYCLCGLVGLALLEWAKFQDEQDTKRKWARMQQSADYTALASGFHEYRRLLPKDLSDLRQASASAPDEASSVEKWGRVAVPLMRICLPSSFVPSVVSTALDVRSVVVQAQNVMKAFKEWLGGDSVEPPTLLASNSMNMLTLLMRYKLLLNYFEVVMLLTFLLFYFTAGFADDLIAIVSELTEEQKVLVATMIAVALLTPMLLKATQRGREHQDMSDDLQKQEQLVLTISVPDGSSLLSACPASSGDGLPRIQLTARSSDVSSLPAEVGWVRCDVDNVRSIIEELRSMWSYATTMFWSESGWDSSIPWSTAPAFTLRTAALPSCYLVRETGGSLGLSAAPPGPEGTWTSTHCADGGGACTMVNRLGQELSLPGDSPKARLRCSWVLKAADEDVAQECTE